MYRLTVCYGHPSDPAAFDRYYEETHAPLARQVPGLADYTGGRCGSLDRSQPAYYYLAFLDFASEEDFRSGLSSAEMAKAGADVANFATGGVSMLTQELADHLTAAG